MVRARRDNVLCTMWPSSQHNPLQHFIQLLAVRHYSSGHAQMWHNLKERVITTIWETDLSDGKRGSSVEEPQYAWAQGWMFCMVVCDLYLAEASKMPVMTVLSIELNLNRGNFHFFWSSSSRRPENKIVVSPENSSLSRSDSWASQQVRALFS